LFTIYFQNKAVVGVGEHFFIDNGEIKGLWATYGDVPKPSLVTLIK
jgi:hypothetical protein